MRGKQTVYTWPLPGKRYPLNPGQNHDPNWQLAGAVYPPLPRA